MPIFKTKTEDFQSIRSQQWFAGTNPPVGAVLAVDGERGHAGWTVDLSLNSVSLSGGVLTYSDVSGLLVNGGPVGSGGGSGAQGLRGATGAQGLQGATGAQGLQGATGAQGLQGATGAQGPPGSGGGGTGSSYWNIIGGYLSPTTQTAIKITPSENNEFYIKDNIIGIQNSSNLNVITMTPGSSEIRVTDGSVLTNRLIMRPTDIQCLTNSGSLSMTPNLINIRDDTQDVGTMVRPGEITVDKLVPTIDSELTRKDYVDSLVGFREENHWYVATNGNDTTGNGSITKPYRTIQTAVTSAQAVEYNPNTTQVIHIAAGEYVGDIAINRPNIWLIGKGISQEGSTVSFIRGRITFGFTDTNYSGGQNGLIGLYIFYTIPNLSTIQDAASVPHTLLVENCHIIAGQGSGLSQTSNVTSYTDVTTYIRHCKIENDTSLNAGTNPIIYLNGTQAIIDSCWFIARWKNPVLESFGPSPFTLVQNCILEQTNSSPDTAIVKLGGQGSYQPWPQETFRYNTFLFSDTTTDKTNSATPPNQPNGEYAMTFHAIRNINLFYNTFMLNRFTVSSIAVYGWGSTEVGQEGKIYHYNNASYPGTYIISAVNMQKTPLNALA